MRISKQIWLIAAVLIVISALYRVIPGRPLGFAPQLAIAVFSGALFTHKKGVAFIMPLASMLISDVLFEVLYRFGLTTYIGFYEGQILNYVLISLTTLIGFFVKPHTIATTVLGLVAAPTTYFLASNFLVWQSGGGFKRAKTFEGLMACYTDALPFYQGSLMGTLVFGVLLFGGWYAFTKSAAATASNTH